MATSTLAIWMQCQRLKAPTMKNEPPFYRNLEEALDIRRKDHGLYAVKRNLSREGLSVDFCSNDFLGFGTSGRLRTEFEKEMDRYPGMPIGSGGSRTLDGNYDYLLEVEKEIADFHKADTCLMLGSGFEANVAIFAAIPRPGDAIVYDELSHASTYDGMEHSLATIRIAFRHNDVDSLQDQLMSVRESQPLIKQGKRCILVAVESVYSMDGDLCPLREMIEVARDVFPGGNVEFIVDEAHATGLLGPNGEGLVGELGLEREIAIRVHTFGKALASTGAVILGKDAVKSALINFARSVVYTTSPSFPAVAAIRSGYRLLKEPQTHLARAKVPYLVRHFFKTITSKPVWDQATETGVVWIPGSEDWEDEEEFVSHIVPVMTQPKCAHWLCFHLHLSDIAAMPMEYPVVPKGKDRIRVTFHSHNTELDAEKLASVICEWAQEMIDIREGKVVDKIPKAARHVYSTMTNGDGHPA